MNKPLQLIIRVWLQECINDEVDYGSHEADVDFDKHVDGIEQAILDWHNKQMLAELGDSLHNDNLDEAAYSDIEHRYDKYFDKLKESK